jgi:flagellin-specific chaperone FliS
MYNAYRAQEYRQQEVMGASPLHLVILTYDAALQACEQKDLIRSTRAVSLLRDSLNFDYADTALGLFRLYQWCLDCIRQGDYPEAMKVLRSLREAWVTVEKQQTQAAQAPLSRSLAGLAAVPQSAY